MRNLLRLLSLALCGVCSLVAAQDRPPDGGPALFSRKPPAADPRDDELRKLLKARFATALKEGEAQWEMYQVGRSTLDPLQETAVRRLFPAGMEALSDAAERLAFCEQYVEFMRLIERYAKSKFDAGAGSAAEMLQATYGRQDAEIQLLKLRAPPR